MTQFLSDKIRPKIERFQPYSEDLVSGTREKLRFSALKSSYLENGVS